MRKFETLNNFYMSRLIESIFTSKLEESITLYS